MSYLMRQSTAATLKIGPVLDSSGVEYTGMVIGDIEIDKNGTEAAMASAATLTHEANGHYELVLTTGNTDTLGRLRFYSNKSTYQFPDVRCMVLPATVYDAHVTNATNTNGGLLAATAATTVNANVGTTQPVNFTGTGSSAYAKAGLWDMLGTTLSEGASGRIAAAWQAAWNIVSPVWTAASVNQTADNNTILANGTYGLSALKTLIDTKSSQSSVDNVATAITNLNNLSALINVYGSPLLEIPDSSSTLFAFTVVVRDNEGKLVDLDASPTIAAANAAGTSRSANLSSVSHPATGRYTFTYSVASDAAEESLRITITGAVSSEGRYIEWIGAVVNYDTLTQIAAIKAKTDNLPASPAAVGSAMTLEAGERTAIGTAVWTSGTRTLSSFGTLVSDVATAVWSAGSRVLTGTLTTFDQLHAKLLKYFQLALRKDAAIATDNATELTAINADGGSGAGGYLNTSDSQQALRDNYTTGGDTILVGPLSLTQPDNRIRNSGTTQAFRYCPLPAGPLVLIDGNLDPVDISTHDVKMILTEVDGDGTFTLLLEDDELAVGGADGNEVTVDYLVEVAGNYEWRLFSQPPGGDWDARGVGHFDILDGPDPRV